MDGPTHITFFILARVAPLLKLAPKWRGFLARVICEEDLKVLRAHSIPADHWERWRFWRRSNENRAGS